MKSELQKLYDLIEECEVAMMTTRRQDGLLRSRPMANQKQAPGADLWFVTAEGNAVLEEIQADPNINLAYFKASTMEWVSVSGEALISRDRTLIRELYMPDWSVWFSEEGDPRHGTAEDPRMVLIGVTVRLADFLEVNKSKPATMFEIAKGWFTGEEPGFGEQHRLQNPHRG